ncbi:MAG: hypothetical protein ABIG44_04370 [Planctomycetota bacterium]
MRKHAWKMWALAMASGAVLLQTPACVETATIVTSVAQVITAGGVVYIVSRVME